MLLAGMDMDRDFPFACHEKGRLPSFIHIYRTQLKVDTYIVPISPSAFSTILEFQAEKVNNLVNLNSNTLRFFFKFVSRANNSKSYSPTK